VVAVLLVGRPLLTGRVYNGGDITRLYLPQRVELARALRENRLPWWTSRMALGYPLVAEGETGALYPPNWLIYSWLSPETGLTLSIMLHYAWAALGMVVFCHVSGRSWCAGLLAGITMAFGGFVGAHLTHIAILTVASWLPWILTATRLLMDWRHPRRNGVALAVCVALQFYGGHPQVSLLGLLATAAYVLWRTTLTPECRWRRLAAWCAAVCAGTVLASPQLLPAFELALQSQRAGGLDETFFTSYSFHPLLTATYLSPFVLGAPSPEGSIELMAYVGLLPVILAAVALLRGQGQERWFFAVLGVVGIALAFGRWNPLYAYLQRVPVLNLFRVPARYLYWTSLSLAYLAALGADALLFAARTGRASARALAWSGGAFALAGIALVTTAPGLEGAIAVWRWLPLIWAFSAALTVWGACGLNRVWWGGLAVLSLVCDLGAYGIVLGYTYHTSAPAAAVRSSPLVVPVLLNDDAQRLYAKEDILPALSVMQNSLYPNVAATYGLSSANLYSPLEPRNYLAWAERLDSAALSRMGVTHYLIPQLLPVDAERELYDVYNPFTALPYGDWLTLQPVAINAIEVESYLSHSAELPKGTLAAEIVLRGTEGQEERVPLRVGIETAEWAYERPDVAKLVAYPMPTVARSWPSRSGYLPWEHAGHTYLAKASVDMTATAIEIVPALPEAYVRVEEVSLLTDDGRSVSLRTAIGQSRQHITYRSEDVLVYANDDAWPRAYAVAWNRAVTAAGGVSVTSLTLDEIQPVTIVSYGDMDVELRVTVNEESLVVLNDLDYPGWVATVDGRPACILSVDGVVRGVRVTAGEHTIAYRYHPVHLPRR